ncbi:enolase-phosphatase E1-like [Branchiostoma lanceolatum]|uniref:enolase-phosphatase E1-like n=1 Tax=Branchiostoma lanceolatum TaxID=7740 RepID=UPI003451FBAD
MADCVPVKFTLRGKTSGEVFVLGSWDDWSQKTKLEESEDTLENSTWMTLPCGYYEYKFKINDHWIHDKTQPTVLNRFKTLNNFVNVVKNPGVVVSDTSDQAANTVNDKLGDRAGSQEKQEHPQYTEKVLTSILKPEKLATIEKQEGDEDPALNIDPLKDIEVESEQHFEHVVDMPQESLVDLEQVSSIEIKPFGSSQQSMEEEKVPEPCVTPARDDIKTITVELENEGGSTTNPDISENVETNSTSSKGSEEVVTKTAQDEDTVDLPVMIESSEETSVKASPIEEAHGTSEVDVVDMGIDTSTEEEKSSPSICETIHLLEDTPVKDKLEKEAEDATVHKSTYIGGDKVTTERKLQQEVASYLAKDEETQKSEVVATKESEIVDRNIQPALQEEQLEKVASNTIDKGTDETVPQKETHTKTDIGSPEREANENLAVELASKEATHKEDDISKAVPDSIGKVADDTDKVLKEMILKEEERAPLPPQPEPVVEIVQPVSQKEHPLKETHTKTVIGSMEGEANENMAEEVALNEITHKDDDVSKPVEKVADDTDRKVQIKKARSDEADKVLKEMILKEEERAPLPPQPEPVVEIVQPVSQKEHPGKTIEETWLSGETPATNAAVGGPDKEVNEPVVEKHSQKERPGIPIKEDREKVEETVSHKTEKFDQKFIQDIPGLIKADIVSDEVPPKQNDAAIVDDLKKDVPPQYETATKRSCETTLQPTEHKAIDETEPPKEAVNNVEIMVDGVVQQITTTAIQEAGEDVSKTSPQQGTVETDAMNDMAATTRKKLTEATDDQDVGKKAVLNEFNKGEVEKDVDNVIIAETPQQPTQDVMEEVLQDKAKEEVEVTPQNTSPEGRAKIPLNQTEAEQGKSDQDVADELKESAAEVVLPQVDTKAVPADTNKAEVVTEMLQEKEKDETPKVVDVEMTTKSTLDATANIPDTTDSDKPRKTLDKTRIEIEPQQEDDVVLENTRKEKAPPKDDTTKEAVSKIKKETEKSSYKVAPKEVTTDTVVKEYVDNEADRGDKVVKEADKTVKPEVEEDAQNRVGKTAIETAPRQEIAEKATFDKTRNNEDKDAIKEEPQVEKTNVDVPKEQKTDKPKVHIERHPVEEGDSKVDNLEAEIKPQEVCTVTEQTIVKPLTEVERETGKPWQAVDKTDKHIPPPQETKKAQDQKDAKLKESKKDSREEPVTEGADIPVHLQTEKQEKPQTPATPESMEDMKKKEGPTSRLSFWKKDKSTSEKDDKSKPEKKKKEEKPTTEKQKSATEKEKRPKSEELWTEKQEKPKTPALPESTKKTEGPTSRLAFWKKDKPTSEKKEKSKPEKKPSSEELSTEKPQTPAIPESADETKNTEGPTSRFAFWKKKDKSTEKEPSEKASIEKKEKPATEEPTTEKDKAKTSDDVTDDVTKPQGFLGILRCCRCF